MCLDDRPWRQSVPIRAAPETGRILRPEIQALRAVAVATVVVCHVWPSVLPGGFVGVDVFFAISGFLITSHLLREIERRDGVSLAGFWARRARRILPAALFVIAFCALATLALVPSNHWQQWFDEMRASTLYVQNWQLAGGRGRLLRRRERAVGRPALLVAVGRGAVLPAVAAAAPARRCRDAPAPAVAAARARRRDGRPGRAELRVFAVPDGDQPGRRVLRHAHARVGVRRRRPARAVRAPRPPAAPASAPSVSWAGLAAIAIASAAFSGDDAVPGRRRAAPGARRAGRDLGRSAGAAVGPDAADGTAAGAVPGRHLLLGLPLALAAADPGAVRARARRAAVADVRDRRADDPRRVADQDLRRGPGPRRPVPHPPPAALHVRGDRPPPPCWC